MGSLSPSGAGFMAMQPSSHIAASDIQISNHIGTININGKKGIFKAAELAPADSNGNVNTDGTLGVHLVDDPAGSVYFMPLLAGGRNGAVFDAITDTGTVSLAQVTLFPAND